MKTNLRNSLALNHRHSVQIGCGDALKRGASVKMRPLPLLLMMVFGVAMANPNGPQVISGKVDIVNQGNVLTITNSNNAIINWQNFSINADELTRFVQPNANSSVLNRVTGNYSSQILGALQSNGKVFLINPNGVLFGKGARIDVNGLVASSLHLSNNDFLSGKSQFSQVGAAGKVENQGTITTPSGGKVFLIAPNVENSGLINAPNGDIVLAAGKSVQLVDSGNPDLHVVVSAPENQAINLGQIISHGGRIGIYGALVSQRGNLNANSAVIGKNGKIILKASQDAVLESGSSTSVTSVDEGGTISVLGKRVIANGTASLDASGALHGGTILLGGDFQGKNPNVMNAEQSFIGKSVTVTADATKAGDGGKVIVWSDKLTEAYGTISAKGAGAHGNGGFAEVSGKAKLDFHGKANLAAGVAPAAVAATGKIGNLLLDPAVLEIAGGSADSASDGQDKFQGGSTAGTINYDDSLSKIYQSELEGITGNIHLEAGERIFTSGTFNNSQVLLKNNSNLTMTTRNGLDDTGSMHGIDLTTSAHGSALEFKTQGTGSITLHTGTGNYQYADVMAGKLTTAGGPVFIDAKGEVTLTGAIHSNNGNIAVNSKYLNLSSTADLNSGTGKIELAAKAPNSEFIMDAGAKITASSGNTAEVIIIKADNMTLPNSGITVTGSGTVTLGPNDSYRDIVVTNTKTGTSLELYPSELAGVTAPIVSLNTPANITFDQAISFTNAGGIVLFGNNATINQALTVPTTNGKISINAGSSIDLGAQGSLQTYGADSGIALRTEAVNINGGANSINADAGKVIFGTLNPSTQINIGAGAIGTAGVLAVTDSTLRKVTTSGSLQVGETSLAWTGNLNVVGALDLTTNSGLTGKLDLVAANHLNVGAQVKAPNDLNLRAGDMLSTVSNASLNAPAMSLRANRMDLQSGQGSIDVGPGLIEVGPNNNTWKVNLGGANGSDTTSSTLELSDTELKTFAGTGTLAVGVLESEALTAGNLQVVGAIAPSFSGVLSLRSSGNIGQDAGATITTNKLAVHSTGSVNLPEANAVANLAGKVGNVQNPNKTFQFNSAVNLEVSSLDNLPGIAVALDASTFNEQAPDGWIGVRSGGNLTQASGALIGGKALYAEGKRVTLHEQNLLGVIAGKTTGSDAGDIFKFKSAANILVSRVGGFDGIHHTGPNTPIAIHLSTPSGGVSQTALGKLVTVGGVKVESAGHVGLGVSSNNQVAAIGISANGPVAFTNSTGELAVGTSGLGISTNNNALDIQAQSGNLKITQDVNVGTGNMFLRGDNVTLGGASSGVNLTGGTIGIMVAAANGQLNTVGAPSAIGTSASNEVFIRADNLNFAFKPTFTAHPSTGSIHVSNQSNNVPFALNASADANWVANFVGFGDNAENSTSKTTNLSIGTPLTVPSKLGIFVNGSISQSAAITAPWAVFHAKTGSILLNQANQINNIAANSNGEFSLTNSGALNIEQYSRNAVTITGIDTSGGNGNVTIDNTGGIIINHPISSGDGDINVLAHSPLTVNNSVISTGGNITLEAGASGSTNDNLTIAGNGTVSTTGAILLKAGNTISDNLSGNNIVRQAFRNPPVLPSLSQCISNPGLSGCDSVLPTINDCVASSTLPGCSVVLPSLSSCIATPTQLGCSVTLPTLSSCISTPSLAGCEVVLPNITACIATPSLPGCSVTLPSLTACVATPSLPGCAVVLPTMSTCIATPSLPGCSVTLPNLSACIATPSLTGCEVVLPNLSACIATPTLPGCGVTLPNLSACIATPTLPGCTVVLPNLTACIATPSLPGCSVVLPNLTACMATPTLPGCSVVLPTLTACIATPTLPGCSTVLPNLTACIATPTLPGCSVVLPNLTACIATPSLPGCSTVLPNLTACIATPTLPGCSTVLPNLTACIATPTLPGCSVVLPNLTACIATPTLPGCSTVLPTLAACLATPSLPGCTVTLPNLVACISTPNLPGCSVVLPNLTACTATPNLPGCSVILPSLAACVSTPTLAGCSAVLPTLASCTSNPSLSGCVVVLPPTQSSSGSAPLEKALDSSVNIINTTTSNTGNTTQVPTIFAGLTQVTKPEAKVEGTAPAPTSLEAPKAAETKTGETKLASNDTSTAPKGDAKTDEAKKADAKKDEEAKKEEPKKGEVSSDKDSGAKKDEPVKKLYCN